MSKESLRQFANSLLSDSGAQRDLQNAVNDFASSLVDAGQSRGFEFTVEELGTFLAQTFFPDGSTPETPADDRREWASVIQKVLGNLRVSNPDHQMFQTMSFDSAGGDEHLRELLEQAAQNQQNSASAKPTVPTPTPDVAAFEPEDTYFDGSTATDQDVQDARRRMQDEGAKGDDASKPFWKVW